MPQVGEKRKRGQRDFEKKKTKVGKKKIPNNATRTEFKSRAIRMPTQSIAERKEEATTSRNLTLTDLLAHLSHYNVNQRKQGIEGLRELGEMNNEEGEGANPLISELGRVFQHCCKLITDLEASVRQTLLSFFSFLLQQFPTTTIEPHLRLIVIYICNGMTHLRKDVRSHSLDFLDVLLAHCSLREFSAELIPNYLYLLSLASRSINNSANTDSTSSSSSTNTAGSMKLQKKMKPTSSNMKLKILSSLYKYLKSFMKVENDVEVELEKSLNERELTNSSSGSQFYWSGNKMAKIAAAFAPTRNTKLPFDYHEQTYAKCLQFTEVVKGANSGKIEAVLESTDTEKSEQFIEEIWWHALHSEKEIEALANHITPILVNFWLETSPSEYPNTLDNLLMMQRILETLALIYVNAGSYYKGERKVKTASSESYEKLKKYLFVYFPFSDHAIRLPGETKSIDISRKFNRSICLLMKRFICKQEINNVNENGQKSIWVRQLFEFLNDSMDASHSENMKAVLTVLEQYCKANEDVESNAEIFRNFNEFFAKTPVSSPLKSASLFFIQKMFQLKFKNEIQLQPDTEQQWLLELPRLLWKIRASKLYLSELILNILLDYAVHMNQPSSQAAFDQVQPRLILFFHSNFKNNSVFGPFVELPESIQQKAVYLLYHFSSISLPLLNALAMCCHYTGDEHDEHLSYDIVLRILEIISEKSNTLSIPQYASFLLNVLLGVSNSPGNKETAEQIANWMCAHVQSVAFHTVSVHLLGPNICFILPKAKNAVQKSVLLKLYAATIHCASPLFTVVEIFRELSSHQGDIAHSDVLTRFSLLPQE